MWKRKSMAGTPGANEGAAGGVLRVACAEAFATSREVLSGSRTCPDATPELWPMRRAVLPPPRYSSAFLDCPACPPFAARHPPLGRGMGFAQTNRQGQASPATSHFSPTPGRAPRPESSFQHQGRQNKYGGQRGPNPEKIQLFPVIARMVGRLGNWAAGGGGGNILGSSGMIVDGEYGREIVERYLENGERASIRPPPRGGYRPEEDGLWIASAERKERAAGGVLRVAVGAGFRMVHPQRD